MPTRPLRLHPLPYLADSAALFAALASRPWAVFLDSGFPRCQTGRYDIIAADPVCTLTTVGEVTTVRSAAGAHQSQADPLLLLRQQLARLAADADTGAGSGADLPFCGGAIGYFAYDLARRLEQLPSIAHQEGAVADMAVGIYRWAVVVDHQRRQAWLLGQGLDEAEWQQVLAQFAAGPAPCYEPCSAPSAAAPFTVTTPVTAAIGKDAYAAAFARIKRYLLAGDCYQVNFAQRFHATCAGDPWPAYLALRQANPAPFAAYLHYPFAQVLCSSPERFLKLVAGRVETRPIKGTVPRRPAPADDARQMALLAASGKDRAENLMIVDLLRNDLGKVCRPGSVKVPELFAVESYATVHHLVSTVTGVLADGQQAVDLLRSCFPGGSITGAPKIRAMEIIEELETHRRGIYCGAIGYIGFDGAMDTNIAIRTMVKQQDSIHFWAGGGIVFDSDADSEYQECFDKAAAMLAVLDGLGRQP